MAVTIKKLFILALAIELFVLFFSSSAMADDGSCCCKGQGGALQIGSCGALELCVGAQVNCNDSRCIIDGQDLGVCAGLGLLGQNNAGQGPLGGLLASGQGLLGGLLGSGSGVLGQGQDGTNCR